MHLHSTQAPVTPTASYSPYKRPNNSLFCTPCQLVGQGQATHSASFSYKCTGSGTERPQTTSDPNERSPVFPFHLFSLFFPPFLSSIFLCFTVLCSHWTIWSQICGSNWISKHNSSLIQCSSVRILKPFFLSLYLPTNWWFVSTFPKLECNKCLSLHLLPLFLSLSLSLSLFSVQSVSVTFHRRHLLVFLKMHKRDKYDSSKHK